MFRPINRLDRETSGVVLIARHQLAASQLSLAMRQRQIKKSYLAILDGDIAPAVGVIDAPIRRAEQSIILREVCAKDAPGAQSALTHYHILSRWRTKEGCPRSLVYACPQTGRTHQLRLHFAHLSAPIAGDRLYGKRDEAPLPDAPPRQCLHAFSLTFVHPATGKQMTVKAPLADDIFPHLPDHVRLTLPQMLAQVTETTDPLDLDTQSTIHRK